MKLQEAIEVLERKSFELEDVVFNAMISDDVPVIFEVDVVNAEELLNGLGINCEEYKEGDVLVDVVRTALENWDITEPLAGLRLLHNVKGLKSMNVDSTKKAIS